MIKLLWWFQIKLLLLSLVRNMKESKKNMDFFLEKMQSFFVGFVLYFNWQPNGHKTRVLELFFSSQPLCYDWNPIWIFLLLLLLYKQKGYLKPTQNTKNKVLLLSFEQYNHFCLEHQCIDISIAIVFLSME